MSLKDDLIKARSYIVFIAGLLTAFALVYYIETHATVRSVAVTPPALFPSVIPKGPAGSKPSAPAAPAKVAATAPAGVRPVAPAGVTTAPTSSVDLPAATAKRRKANEADLAAARTAWAYFTRNTEPSGLVNSVDAYPASTLWDTGSTVLALLSAEPIGILSREELEARAGKLLDALARLPLFDGRLPNKSYNTRTLAMVTYTNQETAQGIGWSAVDLGRMLLALQGLKKSHPALASRVDAVLARWKIADAVADGHLVGAYRDKQTGAVRLHQEGRLGYEQYAAAGFARSGIAAPKAADYGAQLRYLTVDGAEIPVDAREPSTGGGQNYALSEPWILLALETGLPGPAREMARRIYLAQQARHAAGGPLTAVSEDHLDRPPYFVYSTVYSGGTPWAVLTPDGKDAADFRLLSLKTAFAWDAVYADDYTAQLVGAEAGLSDPAKGWYAGRYEKSGETNRSLNANTNAIVLEAIAYRLGGPLLP